jgi:hypothetical protein
LKPACCSLYSNSILTKKKTPRTTFLLLLLPNVLAYVHHYYFYHYNKKSASLSLTTAKPRQPQLLWPLQAKLAFFHLGKGKYIKVHLNEILCFNRFG